jgi:hypothetical protein
MKSVLRSESAMNQTVLDNKRTWILRAVPEPAEKVAAWEMIEAGRFMPRRIRGSFPGRELG